MDVLGKNGKPLRGAAKQSSLAKRFGATWNKEDVDITVASFDCRIDSLEKRIKYLPLTAIAALFLGCAAGKLFKPDLVAVAIGSTSAGAGMAITISRQN